MSTWELVAGLPVTIEGYGLDGMETKVSSDFDRKSTVITIHGSGQIGVGEDVTYDAVDHDVQQRTGPVHKLAGSWTLGDFCDHIDGLDLFAEEPVRPVSRLYRRWAFHSAALDLALRQAGSTRFSAARHGRSPSSSRSASASRRQLTTCAHASIGIRRSASSSTRPSRGPTR